MLNTDPVSRGLVNFDRRIHVLGCSFDGADSAQEAWRHLSDNACGNASTLRLLIAGEWLVAVGADDEAAASYMARLAWGDGVPVGLADDVAELVASKRRAGAAETRRSGGDVRRLAVRERIEFTDSLQGEVVRCGVLNTNAEPWPVEGGICGAMCPSMADAEHVREVIVTEQLADLDGLIIAFGNDTRAVLAVIAETPEVARVAGEAVQRLAGNLDYRPDAHGAWALWALRLEAGAASLPISFTGDRAQLNEFLTGRNMVNPRVKAHPPGRNQPCVCGSGLKYKRCCGAE